MTTRPSWLGHFNEPPPNLTTITEAQFWQKFDSGAADPTSKERAWLVHTPKDHPFYATNLVLFCYSDDTAVGFVRRVHEALPAPPTTFVRAARCNHTFTERTVGRCLHEYRCTLCDYAYTVDSSD
jgi:hypothetical protein